MFGFWRNKREEPVEVERAEVKSFEAATPPITQKRNDNVGIYFSGFGANDIILPSGYTSLAKNEDVKKCVHKIADLVSNMTIMLMENTPDGDRRLRNELSKKIDVYPNKLMTRKNFIYRIVTDMLLTGNSVVIPEVGGGLLQNLILCNVGSVSFRGDEHDYEVTYKNVTFKSDEVLHFVLNPDENYHFRGQGYAHILKDTVSNLAQANATKQSFLQSKWKPSVIIKVHADVEELQDPDMREKLLDSYIDNSEAGKPWIIPAEEMDIHTLTPLTLNDLAVNDGIILDKQSIAGAFGVPPFMLGVGTFNREEYNNFISSAIMPVAKIIEQELTKKLIFSNGWYFKFNVRSLMQYNLSEMTTHVKELTQLGIINRNEGRNMFDLSPVEGLNEYALLENYVPVDAIGKQKKLIQDETTDPIE